MLGVLTSTVRLIRACRTSRPPQTHNSFFVLEVQLQPRSLLSTISAAKAWSGKLPRWKGYVVSSPCQRALSLAVCACVLLAQASLAQVIQHPRTLTQQLSHYLEADNFDHSYDHLIWGILRDSIKGTPLEGHVSVNSAPKANNVIVYLVKRDPDSYFMGIMCNCAYVGESNTIICDSSLLSYLSNLLKMDFRQSADFKREEASYLNYRTSDFLLHWVFGHELGHVLSHHQIAPAYFTSPASADERSKAHTLGTEEEEVADSFATRTLKTPYDQVWAWFALGHLIKTLYLDALQKQSAATGSSVISDEELYDLIFSERVKLMLPTTGDPHLPWLVRALKFESLVRSRYPAAVFDNTEYYPKMLNSITLAPGSADAVSLCESKLIAKHDAAVIKLPESVIDDYQLRRIRTLDLMKIYEYKAAERAATQWISALSSSAARRPEEIAEPYEIRGESRAALNKDRQAIADFKVVLRHTPNDPITHDNLGFSYFRLGNINRAISELRKSASLRPDLADAWAGLGVAYFSLGKLAAGLKAFKQALQIQPLYAEPDYLRLQAFFSDKELNIALRIVAKLKEIK
jgi:tetratricopeptide (TPR) repeat protein